MITIRTDKKALVFDPAARAVVSLTYAGREYITAPVPVFELSLLDRAGQRTRLTAADAAAVTETADGAVFSGFPLDITVTLRVGDSFPVSFAADVVNHTDCLIEWVDCPRLCLPALRGEGGDGEMLFPYNEGVLFDSLARKEQSLAAFREPLYPSLGCYTVFPNMLCSQFMCRLQDGAGLYLGMHDPARGVKQLDVRPYENGMLTVLKTFRGGAFGCDSPASFGTVIDFFDGGWTEGAAIYRAWFEANLPAGASRTAETGRDRLPAWYADSPLMVSYPVRGIHDMDEMKPNALFPYTNALPLLDDIAARTGCRLMALLMHWEGTAPWAPPYVWPPFGGVDCFNEFRDALHERGHLLGVYCSGFGYTKQSNLLPFGLEEEFERDGNVEAMTADESGEVRISRICTGQRSGYDLCVANAKARRILARAYGPLFASGADYAQILDQNHGGGQYLCYARGHEHAPCPGAWMTDSMQRLLTDWNREAGSMLLGCESAASEPFIGNLRFSDNRYELNWTFGSPVPLYAFIYHEYVRNFMGNQVCCGIVSKQDSLRMRLAYSYTAGDALTLVLTPDGDLMSDWGTRDFVHHPDKDKTLDFIAALKRLSDAGASDFLIDGRMIPAVPVDTPVGKWETVTGVVTEIPDVFTTAWEKDGRQVQLFVNHTDEAVTFPWNGGTLTVPARDGIMAEL